ncbi:uncharacterized protein L3040_005973 [Drepanopeziza brunnea f. sp. 'multigermtubi']|nr:hypothetical protein L3040_005973 [Drepanopeziza brunnea f. sp. 'multigermtubi']
MEIPMPTKYATSNDMVRTFNSEHPKKRICEVCRLLYTDGEDLRLREAGDNFGEFYERTVKVSRRWLSMQNSILKEYDVSVCGPVCARVTRKLFAWPGEDEDVDALQAVLEEMMRPSIPRRLKQRLSHPTEPAVFLPKGWSVFASSRERSMSGIRIGFKYTAEQPTGP